MYLLISSLRDDDGEEREGGTQNRVVTLWSTLTLRQQGSQAFAHPARPGGSGMWNQDLARVGTFVLPLCHSLALPVAFKVPGG